MKIARILCALFGALVVSAHAETTWNRFGAAPYAESLEEGCRKAPEAIDGFSLPPEVKIAFKEKVGTRCLEEGVVVWFTPGDRLDEMWTGGQRPHVLKSVNVADVPVTKSPDGRAYRKGAVSEALKAWTWSTTYQAKKYVLVLPAVCSNWSWYSITLPPPPVAAAAPAPARALSAAPTGPCPQGYMLTAHAWELSKLPDALRTQAEGLIGAATRRESSNAKNFEAYKPDDFSRTLGGKLRREVKVHALENVHITVRLLDPTTLAVVEQVGPLNLVDGVGSVTLTEAQHRMIIETIWPASFKSPTVSGGARRNRLFPEEWGTWCSMNVHGATP